LASPSFIPQSNLNRPGGNDRHGRRLLAVGVPVSIDLRALDILAVPVEEGRHARAAAGLFRGEAGLVSR
jgi:hypothetical protein